MFLLAIWGDFRNILIPVVSMHRSFNYRKRNLKAVVDGVYWVIILMNKHTQGLVW